MSDEIKWIANLSAGWVLCIAWQAIKAAFKEKSNDHTT